MNGGRNTNSYFGGTETVNLQGRRDLEPRAGGITPYKLQKENEGSSSIFEDTVFNMRD